MASIYKRKGRRKYSIIYRDINGKRRILVGTTSKEGTRRIADKIEDHIREQKLGVIDVKIEKIAQNESYPLPEHIDDFEEYLESKGVTDTHIAKTISYVNEIVRECKFQTPSDIDACRVSEYLLNLRRNGKVLLDRHGKFLRRKSQSIGALNGKLTAIKSFCSWMYRNDRMRTDPLKALARGTKGERANKVHARRALSDEEIARLLDAVLNGPDYRGISGSERAVIYQLALETGLRYSEIKSLTPVCFGMGNPNQPTVTVLAAYSKHRRDDTLPLRRDFAAQMTSFIANSNKRPQDRLFKFPEQGSRMIQSDLNLARDLWINEAKTDEERQRRTPSDFLKYRNSQGLYCDFHSLRHTFISRLARSGVSPKIAQMLARHSTITLTLDLYTHVLLDDQRGAINQLPAISPERTSLKSTGSDDDSLTSEDR